MGFVGGCSGWAGVSLPFAGGSVSADRSQIKAFRLDLTPCSITGLQVQVKIALDFLYDPVRHNFFCLVVATFALVAGFGLPKFNLIFA